MTYLRLHYYELLIGRVLTATASIQLTLD